MRWPFLRRGRRDADRRARDLDLEIEFHVEQRARRLMREGVPAGEARRRSEARFGDAARVRAACRAEHRRIRVRARRRAHLEGAMHDLRGGSRILRSSPGFALAVIGILAVGIGASTAVFGVINTVLLSPLPYADPARLVAIEREHTAGPEGPTQLSAPDFALLRARLTTARMTALDESVILPLIGGDRPIHTTLTPSVPDYFEVIGVRPLLGRTFRPDEGFFDPESGWEWRPLIISHELWQREFGGDPLVIGRAVSISTIAGEVVGVMPPDFLTLMPAAANTAELTDGWYPSQWDFQASSPASARLRGLARVEAGVALETLQAELDTIAAQLQREVPYNGRVGKRFRVVPLQAAVSAHALGRLRARTLAVTLVMLVACANVANLLLANGGRRQREMAVRAALGASRTRLVRQLLSETAVLGALAAAGGVAIAGLVLALLRSFPPADIPRIPALGLDRATLSFTVLAAVLAILAASLPPAMRTVAAGLRATSSRRAVSDDRRRRRAQGALVVAEVALSIVLLAGAGMMLRSFAALQRVPLGVEPEGLVTLNPTTLTDYGDDRQATEDEILRRLRDIPGVESAGLGFPLPLNGLYERSVPYRRAGLAEHDARRPGLLPHHLSGLSRDAGSAAARGPFPDRRRQYPRTRWGCCAGDRRAAGGA